MIVGSCLYYKCIISVLSLFQYFKIITQCVDMIIFDHCIKGSDVAVKHLWRISINDFCPVGLLFSLAFCIS